MAVKGIEERRHQSKRAKARAKRKLKRWSEGEFLKSLTEKARARIIGIHAKMRTHCSCWMCKREPYDESRKGLRAKADAKDQLD